jgi:hypothetical protein
MAFSPYNRNVLGITPEEQAPRIKEQFSWDEFLSGLAKGGLSGFGVGIDLSKAREAAETRRLAAMEANPEPFRSEYNRRQDLLYGTNLAGTPVPGLDPITNIGDLAAAGIPERREAINLLSARDAREGRLAFSPEARERMKGISDTELGIFEQRQRRTEKEVEASSFKDLMTDYTKHSDTMELLLKRMDSDREALKAAVKTGNPDFIQRAEDRVLKTSERIDEVDREGTRAEAALIKAGVTPEDFDRLRDFDKRADAMRDLLRRVKGTPRIRRPGTK